MHSPTHQPAQRRPQALLIALSCGHHHFPGVAQALNARDWATTTDTAQHHPPLTLSKDQLDHADLILHPDGVNHNATNLLIQTREASKPLVLLMDGVLEYANTFLNPNAGPNFLRPAPGNLVLASGAHDTKVLQALGNHAIATGLPRLAEFARCFKAKPTEPQSTTILIATANQPAFTPESKARLLATLDKIKAAAARRSITLRWRIADELAAELKITNDPRGLAESIASSDAVLTTASTLAIESMIADRPTAIIHPHPWPLWIPAAWIYQPQTSQSIDHTLAVNTHAANTAAAESIAQITQSTPSHHTVNLDSLLDSLLAPDPSLLALQSRILEHTHHADAPARVASAIIEHHNA